MMWAPVSVSPIKSVGTVVAIAPTVIAVPRTDDDAKHGRRNKEDRARRRWRCIVVTGRRRAVRLNHFGARIRPDSGSKTEREYRQRYYNKFFPHDRIFLLLFGRLNPIITAKLPKNYRSVQLWPFVRMPGIAKPIAFKSAASNFAWSVVSSISGGRTLAQSGSLL